MINKWRWSLAGVTLVLLCGAAGCVRGADLRVPVYRAIYSVGRGSLSVGTTRFTLIHNTDGTYTYQSVTVPAGLVALFRSDIIMETSRFSVAGGKLVALNYSYSHTGGGNGKHTETIRFQWDKDVAYTELKGKQRSLAIQPGTYDRLLAQLAVSLDLEAGQNVGEYRVLDHNTISLYHMQRQGGAALKTPAGTYQVIEIARKDPKNRRVTTFWLAPKLDYLPVQMQQTEPGKAAISLVLTEIKFDAANSKVGLSEMKPDS